MTDKSIIRLCEMCFKPTQDDECIHYPDQLNDRPIVKYRVIEFISLTSIKSMILERKEEYQANAVREDMGVMEASVNIGRCVELESLLTHLEEMERK